GCYNTGDFNTGSFNPGDYNTGGFNPGNYNTGYFNEGNSNTGLANSGNVNTGAFISGNYSNGLLWRGDYQGLLGFTYESTVPAIPWNIGVHSDIDIPITGAINTITQDMFTIAEFEIPISLETTICLIYVPFVGCVLHVSVTVPITTEHVGPFVIDPSVINPQSPINTAITDTIDFSDAGTVGPATFGFNWQQSPGFFNSSDTPSSGFFNSGAGGASGLLNDAQGAVSGIGNAFLESSGFFNAGGPGLSGLQNVGTLESGWANFGNSLSGIYNTSILNLMAQAFVSGLGNTGHELSGFLNDAMA
ncbi:pentapeptide repeat-containing protein, partial [Mycobacterium marinum]